MSQLRRSLTLFDITLLVIGGIIGTGIFFNTTNVANRVHTPELILGVWILGGVIAVIGALSFAELGAMMPEAGGEYAFLREGWHPLVGFLYGWTLLLVIASGATAAISTKFASILNSLLPVSLNETVIALGTIWLLAGVNYFGIKAGAVVQNLFTAGKLIALGVLIFAGLSAPAVAVQETAPRQESNLILAIGAALAPVLFTYGGWQNSTYTSEEMKDPARTIPRASILGIAVVVIVYVAVNIIYLRMLPVSAIERTGTLATDVAQLLLGPGGAKFLSVSILVSTFGFIDMTLMTAPRVFFAMGRDGHLFRGADYLHPRYQSPVTMLLFFTIWTTVMLLAGSYDALLGYVTFGDWIFFGLTVAALFRLRKKRPDLPRPYRVWGYPVLPAIFVVTAAVFVILNFVANQPQTTYGLLLILAGIPVFYWKKR